MDGTSIIRSEIEFHVLSLSYRFKKGNIYPFLITVWRRYVPDL